MRPSAGGSSRRRFTKLACFRCPSRLVDEAQDRLIAGHGKMGRRAALFAEQRHVGPRAPSQGGVVDDLPGDRDDAHRRFVHPTRAAPTRDIVLVLQAGHQPADGAGVRRITNIPGFEYQPDWTADGTKLVSRVDDESGRAGVCGRSTPTDPIRSTW